MNELDLFSGLEGASVGFKERGHKVVSVDMDPSFTRVSPISRARVSTQKKGKWVSFAIPMEEKRLPPRVERVSAPSMEWGGPTYLLTRNPPTYTRARGIGAREAR